MLLNSITPTNSKTISVLLFPIWRQRYIYFESHNVTRITIAYKTKKKGPAFTPGPFQTNQLNYNEILRKPRRPGLRCRLSAFFAELCFFHRQNDRRSLNKPFVSRP